MDISAPEETIHGGSNDYCGSRSISARDRGTGAETDLVAQELNLLVNRYQGLLKFRSHFILEKGNQIKVGKERVDCYLLKMETPDGAHEIWVDKNRFIVWRSKDSSPAAQEGITLQRTKTVNMKSANMNTKLDDSMFTLAPPEKATKVQTLNLK